MKYSILSNLKYSVNNASKREVNFSTYDALKKKEKGLE